MDFSNCLINFTTAPKGAKLTEAFPELSAFPEFIAVEDDDEIRIAIATTDMDSPCVKIPDREYMLKQLFEFLGLKTDTKLFEQVLNYKHQRIAACKSRYIQMQHVTDWSQWLTIKQTFDFLIHESNQPKDDEETNDVYVKRRVRIKDDLKKTGNDLKELEAKLFPDSKAAREAANYEAARKIVSYPEKYAQDRSVI